MCGRSTFLPFVTLFLCNVQVPVRVIYNLLHVLHGNKLSRMLKHVTVQKMHSKDIQVKHLNGYVYV